MLAWLVIPDWLKKWAAIVGGVIVATLVRELPKADADPVVGKPGVPRSSVDELHRDWSRD
jgi:hypothetical protein